MKIALFEPEIPPNTGNIIRLCANIGFELHLIKPLGFDLSDKKMRRAGLDYHEYTDLKVHENFSEFLHAMQGHRIFACTTKAQKIYTQQKFKNDDVLLFGPETRGLPLEIRQQLGIENWLKLPMVENSRSLNLSNSVAIFCYEAWRQMGFKNSS
jgi:tRNA (cytidine/uridine-2'-O-)-methyltransferase